MGLCEDYGPLDFRSTCIRASWNALLPVALVFALCVFAIPIPRPVQRLLGPLSLPFKPFITLYEAEAIDIAAVSRETGADEDAAGLEVPRLVPLWRTVIFVFVGMIQAFWWAGDGVYNLYNHHDGWIGISSLFVSVSWMYTVVRPIARPAITAPYDMFALYTVLMFGGVLQLGGTLFDHTVLGVPLPSVLSLTMLMLNFVFVFFLSTIILSMPLGIPSNRVVKEDIGHSVSPEDYTSLWGWLSFSWTYPMIRQGRHTTLHENDVWNVSPTMQSRPISVKFSSITGSRLIWRLWKANSQDLLFDFALTIMSVIFQYGGPFFLKRILDAINLTNPTAESRMKAYIYAFLAFVCTMAKAQTDLQHLWFGRRASTRMRTQLMAAIFDKSLKRKDLSGTVSKDTNETKSKGPGGTEPKRQAKEKKEQDKKDAAKADDPKAGAGVGKIVNLMAGDTGRVSRAVSGLYNIYGAPFEIIIASVFLYQLLGINAFAGFLVLIAGSPMNSYIARRAIRIHKGVMAARDKRMGVLNELIVAVKFIKFFGWEDRWVDRVMDARELEIRWIVKARINQILSSSLYTFSPILVSIISFTVYVLRGNELDIPTAFTAIALFNMIKSPLNTVPTWLVSILQTGVALNRIAVYLEEEEVTDQVSSLKMDHSRPTPPKDLNEGLGLENASFRWNEVTEIPTKGKGKNTNTTEAVATSINDDTRTVVAESGSECSLSVVGERKFELTDLSIKFPERELTVVTGPTASGKTALLMSVLGEMTLLSGRIIMTKEPSHVDEFGLMHSISYAAQSPWLRHQSIKDNILFGSPYDQERYNAVVECCALRPDLEILEDGDLTEIGARGVNLSGGQKARVALARAVYVRTRYVLLDDPLSAVDSHTSRFLYERLLRGPLLANRTVILVTHHVDLVLPGAFYLVRMLDGRIHTQGAVKDLRAQGLLDSIQQVDSADASKDKSRAAEEVAAEGSIDDTVVKSAETPKKPRKLVKDEHREYGGVKWSIYDTYLRASSYWTWIILTMLLAVIQFLSISEKLWIKVWGEAYRITNDTGLIPSTYILSTFTTQEQQSSIDGYSLSYLPVPTYQTVPFTGLRDIWQWPNATNHPLFYIGIYAAIGLLSGVASVLSVAAIYTGALRASRLLFRQLLVTVVRATFRFHDTTPTGRLLNRFGKDIETIDTGLASSLRAVNSSLAGFFASIIAVSVVFPAFLFPAVLIGLAYRELAIAYLNTGRDLRRMESNTRSPIFSDFGEVLEGIVTVRAFSAEKRFLDNLHLKIDMTTKMWYAFWMTNRWLLVNFDTFGGIAVLVTTIMSIAKLSGGAGIAGLCITSSMAFTHSIYWACRYWTTLELDLNCVERVVEYLKLPQEPPAIIESNRVPAYWPSSANNDALVRVEDLEIKYAPELPAVLHNISFTLKAGERVGLLGRTGSGKSTLAMSILRFVDPTAGRILIDEIDISTIGTHDLRSRLTFIPQDATLFSGTLRDNLDPFGEHEDADCLDALRRVHMIAESPSPSRAPSIHLDREDVQTSDSVSTTTTEVDAKSQVNLDTKVSPGGKNFSQGQRQLIAMARALLRRSSIIVLDEATSSIDFEADAKIQNTIREQFTESLLLTVAHRLRTVIDYDRLLVLDNGQIAEFDTPWNLINKGEGIFRTMCLNSGSFNELELAAKAKVTILT